MLIKNDDKTKINEDGRLKMKIRDIGKSIISRNSYNLNERKEIATTLGRD